MELISFEQKKLERAAAAATRGPVTKPTYVDSQGLHRAAVALAKLEPCPYAGRVTEDQVKIALGELLDIWPASIADDS
jgi:hypothetical protein